MGAEAGIGALSRGDTPVHVSIPGDGRLVAIPPPDATGLFGAVGDPSDHGHGPGEFPGEPGVGQRPPYVVELSHPRRRGGDLGYDRRCIRDAPRFCRECDSALVGSTADPAFAQNVTSPDDSNVN